VAGRALNHVRGILPLRPARPGARGPRVAGVTAHLLVMLLATALTALCVQARATVAPAGALGQLVPVIVRGLPGAVAVAERRVLAVGGIPGRRLGIIDGVAAAVPAGRLAKLAAMPGVTGINSNGGVRLLGSASTSTAPTTTYQAAQTIGATAMWNAGYTGKGVDVALIDSGVAPVPGLDASGKVVNGADVSFESQSPYLRYLDTFGHGTHMAGIIAGRDPAWTPGSASTNFGGIAPDARLVSIKAADAFGATDVSQVIAAIDWVVQHRRDNGMNIRVLNLSFGTDGTLDQSYLLSPLAYAAEVAWRNGIVVVAAVGNNSSPYTAGRQPSTYVSHMTDPAFDPFLLAVGAHNGKNTPQLGDDWVPEFSSTGDTFRRPDVIAPGTSIVGLANPGSNVDLTYSGGRVGTRFFKGSGTSQGAAMASGAVALLAQQYPTATPDQLKALLNKTASKIPGANNLGQGNGLINLAAARTAALPTASASAQPYTPSSGTGSLDVSRGSAHLQDGSVVLDGERDIFGRAFNSSTMASAEATATSWQGGTWNGGTWTGSSWSGTYWTTAAWSGTTWAGTPWSSITYSGSRWTGSRWTGGAWTGSRWTGSRWTNEAWSSASWS
jgi:serine protease AprX